VTAIRTTAAKIRFELTRTMAWPPAGNTGVRVGLFTALTTYVNQT
jgi:hypothetical protein